GQFGACGQPGVERLDAKLSIAQFAFFVLKEKSAARALDAERVDCASGRSSNLSIGPRFFL
ncbi:MAG: hypothetical protein ACM3JD_17405, partial [Rudaea sp.]